MAKDIEPEIAAVKKEDVKIISQLIRLVGVNRNNLAEDVELKTVAGKKEDVKNSVKDIELEIAVVKADGAKVVKLDGRQVLKMGAQGMLSQLGSNITYSVNKTTRTTRST